MRNPFYDLSVNSDNNENYATYHENEIKNIEGSELIELYNESFWVLDGMDKWNHLLFLQFEHSDDSGITFSVLCKVNGYSGSLREMRHTWFSDNGYVFYLNRKNFQAMLEYCSKYFDMD